MRGEIEFGQKELDDFAYFSAHDLSGYLRGHKLHISEFENNLPNEYIKSEEFQTIKKDCNILEKIIQSLMEFSELGKVKAELVMISVPELLEELEQRYMGREVVFEYDKNLPTIRADKRCLEYVLDALISNGIKFNHSSKKRLAIGIIDSQDAEYVFFVKDNGIGIDKSKCQEVFKMFKQLNREDQFERGQGVGLSFCRRHIERNGGRIWLESTPKVGTTVFFTLPKILAP